MGFLNNDVLSKEAEKYGAAGNNPQVVWSNGILCSAAVALQWMSLQTGQKKLVARLFGVQGWRVIFAARQKDPVSTNSPMSSLPVKPSWRCKNKIALVFRHPPV
jgi:hypothetical protein